jgi:hypothetical protein
LLTNGLPLPAKRRRRAKNKVASEPEVRQKLHHTGTQRASHHKHQRIAQRGECKDIAGATKPEMGMRGDEVGQSHRLLGDGPDVRFGSKADICTARAYVRTFGSSVH